MNLNLNNNLVKYLNSKKLILAVFSVILIFGSMSVKDYGVSSGEYAARINGIVNLNYIGLKISPEITNKMTKNKDIPYLHDKNYFPKTSGALFDTFTGIIEIITNVDTKYNQFLIRHYINFFIFFFGLICFYKLCNKRFNSWKLSLFGVVLLTLSPRILANSFYNSKDLVFLSFLLFSVYFGIKFFEKINLKNAVLFAFSNVFAISGIQAHGLISPLIIYLILLFYIFLSKNDVKIKIYFLLVSIFFTIFFNLVSWPYLWENPIDNFVNVLRFLGNFGSEWKIPSLFFGEIIYPKDMPWYYSLVWISITTPIFYIIFFITGFIFFIYKLLNNYRKNLKNIFCYYDIIFASIFLIPLIISTISNSFSFYGWSHLYFVYPYFIIFCLFGYIKIDEFLTSKKLYPKILPILTFFIILYYSSWIFINHPHQYAFFNMLAGKDIHKNFDVDYHGLSYKENLNFILENDNKNEIYLKNNSKQKIFYSLLSVKHKDKKRFIWEFDNRDPDYIITNYHVEKIYSKFDKEFLKKYSPIKTILVDDTPINTIFKKDKINGK